MAAKPAEAVERFGRKLVLVLGPTPLSNNGDLDFFRRQRPLLRVLMVVGWGFLLPLGLVGAFIAVRRGGASRYLTVLAGLLILVPVVFFVTSRYRAAALPFLALLAAPAVAALFRGGLSLRKRTGPLLAGALLAVALAFAQDPFLPASNPAYGYLVQGLLEERDGDPRQAEQAYRRALALSPEDSHARRALAFLVLDEGRPEEAEALFRTLVVQNPGAAALRGLGLSLRAQNRHDEALAALERAMRISPGDRRLRALYAEELGEQGLRAAERDNWQASLEWFTAARGNDSSNPFFPFGQATALWSLGRREQAARMMDSLYVANPDFPPAVSWIEHGWRP
jgi:tetratricopeptide (TPR) repeat protein